MIATGGAGLIGVAVVKYWIRETNYHAVNVDKTTCCSALAGIIRLVAVKVVDLLSPLHCLMPLKKEAVHGVRTMLSVLDTGLSWPRSLVVSPEKNIVGHAIE